MESYQETWIRQSALGSESECSRNGLHLWQKVNLVSLLSIGNCIVKAQEFSHENDIGSGT